MDSNHYQTNTFADQSVGIDGTVQQAPYAATAPIHPEVDISISSSSVKHPGPGQPALSSSSSLPSPSADVRNSPVKPMTADLNSIATPSSFFSPIIKSGNSNKVSFNVDKNETKMIPTSSSETSKDSMPLPTADAISSTVELLVNAAELREAAVRESSVANGMSTARAGRGQGGVAENVVALHGGPFTALELGQLSLVCNSAPVVTTSSNCIGSNSIGNSDEVWSSLGEDLLSTLTPMLRTHVLSALGIDLVGEGRNVITKSMEDGENGKKSTIPILQVSVNSLSLS